MEIRRLFLVIAVCTTLGAPYASAGIKGSGYEGTTSHKKGSGAADIAVRGKIYFSDYYSMGGEKCAAFLEAEDGSLFCVLDNIKSNTLRKDMGNTPGKVDVTGSITEDKSGRYLNIMEYDITQKNNPEPQQKGSGREPKGSR